MANLKNTLRSYFATRIQSRTMSNFQVNIILDSRVVSLASGGKFIGVGALVQQLWEETRVLRGRGFRIPAPEIYYCRNCNVCLEKTEIIQKEAGNGPFKKTLNLFIGCFRIKSKLQILDKHLTVIYLAVSKQVQQTSPWNSGDWYITSPKFRYVTW